jgi:hypothetical protein
MGLGHIFQPTAFGKEAHSLLWRTEGPMWLQQVWGSGRDQPCRPSKACRE